MEETIVLEEQKGLWIEERWLRQARLRGALEVVVGERSGSCLRCPYLRASLMGLRPMKPRGY